MTAVPLVAAHNEDFVHVLVQVEEKDTMSEVAEKVSSHSVGVRVEPKQAPLKVKYNGQVQPDHLTVTEVGLEPMDFVEVFYDV
ncbi:toluene-4-monooxygenase system B family protein [Bacillus sp. PK3_68]|uniref:toluene-4-monooxygenase system B family protein n=1 Tax=Bacillus sp. PK3_68 TaxID=2027408 RepID=UPI000E731DFA|nr:toluene-4-monooxygenase system B family protein [Bacillus sp. PK3_68]RJS50157.1 toluene monooxygenase [Bacillus sp. PK3_68]